MSTILEALRRAERERQRGTVPTVHSPAMVLAPAASGAADARTVRAPWMIAGALALVTVAAALLWWWGAGRPQTPLPPSVPAAAAAKPAPPAAVGAEPVHETPPARAPARPSLAPAARRAPAATAGSAPPAGQARQEPAAPAKATVKDKDKATGTGPVFAPADLPASVRAELPVLHVAGITWSANARLRMAIVNGQVLHEGDAAAPGMVLQAIEPARTVWLFRGYRVALASQ